MQQELRFEFQKFRNLENLNFHPVIYSWLYDIFFFFILSDQ